ncbi:hypothetical protein DMC01_12110 [Campylobacter troglodytis]|nr:hypothetical protein [Campylobacter troglodytis]TQR53087.1 hypothetical protein DMC01_12110 [Campylobacter troglodytis]
MHKTWAWGWKKDIYIFTSYYTLASLQEVTKAHYRVKHSENEFAKGHNHINKIVNFLLRFICNFVVEVCKGWLRCFRTEEFFTHLKESEVSSKIKLKNEALYKILLKWLRKNPRSF